MNHLRNTAGHKSNDEGALSSQNAFALKDSLKGHKNQRAACILFVLLSAKLLKAVRSEV